MPTVLKSGRTRKFTFKHELAAGPASKTKGEEQHTHRGRCDVIFYSKCHYATSTPLYVGKAVFSLKTNKLNFSCSSFKAYLTLHFFLCSQTLIEILFTSKIKLQCGKS